MLKNSCSSAADFCDEYKYCINIQIFTKLCYKYSEINENIFNKVFNIQQHVFNSFNGTNFIKHCLNKF